MVIYITCEGHYLFREKNTGDLETPNEWIELLECSQFLDLIGVLVFLSPQLRRRLFPFPELPLGYLTCCIFPNDLLDPLV